MIDEQRKTVIVAEEGNALRTGLAVALEDAGFTVIACPNGRAALDALQNAPIDAMITDLPMCGTDLIIKRAAEIAPEARIIVVTAPGDVEKAVDALKLGACGYLCKPIIIDELIFKLKRLLACGNLTKENDARHAQSHESRAGKRIVGDSPVMRELKRVVRQVAQTHSHVLICGECGSGKEIVARAIHRSGVTRDGPFVPVDCTLLNESAFEGSLCGHLKDALPGAEEDHVGFFEAADGGTLFLDGVDALPIQSQSVLLHAMDQRAVTRVGDTRPQPVAVRIIASTSHALESEVRAHSFREDLYYRLNVIRINTPPLRDRQGDIAALIDYFVSIYTEKLHVHCPGFDDEAVREMCVYAWPGNVRELKNTVERALIVARDRTVQRKDLCITAEPTQHGASYPRNLRMATRDFERRYIANTLAICHNNKALAATTLGIGLSSLYRKIEELGIAKDKTRTT